MAKITFEATTGFISKQECESLITECQDFSKRYYKEYYLEKHIAYFSDKKPGRSSYAFALHSVTGESDYRLPGLKPEELSEGILRNTERVEKELGLKRGRTLFNIQFYMSSSAAVPRHFDGEYFDFDVLPDYSVQLNLGLRPKKVAVLTLLNDVVGGGTRLYFGKESFVFNGKAGDLVVFPNDKCWHSVDPFTGVESNREDGLIRMTIGWRSLELADYYDHGVQREISYEQAVSLHLDYLQNKWPKLYKEMLATGKVAF
jgi:hypothetical protein